MTNETKEAHSILRDLKLTNGENDLYLCTGKENKILLDYITNLQEERNMYKGSFETMSKNYFEEKSKNEKAIEKLKLCNSICAKETIQILQGEDK